MVLPAPEDLPQSAERPRRQTRCLEAREAELGGLGGEAARAAAPVDPDPQAQHLEGGLDELGQLEELVGARGAVADPVDDLAADRLRVAGGVDPVTQPRDAVGDMARLVAAREQDDLVRCRTRANLTTLIGNVLFSSSARDERHPRDQPPRDQRPRQDGPAGDHAGGRRGPEHQRGAVAPQRPRVGEAGDVHST